MLVEKFNEQFGRDVHAAVCFVDPGKGRQDDSMTLLWDSRNDRWRQLHLGSTTGVYNRLVDACPHQLAIGDEIAELQQHRIHRHAASAIARARTQGETDVLCFYGNGYTYGKAESIFALQRVGAVVISSDEFNSSQFATSGARVGARCVSVRKLHCSSTTSVVRLVTMSPPM